MENKMAKFAVVQLGYEQEINQDAFQKFTSKELKKTFKCNKVEELEYCNKSIAEVSKSTGIATHDLSQLSRKLISTELDDMAKIRCGSETETKIFVLSDDASATSLAFDVLKNQSIIKLFQLDDEDIAIFVKSIGVIQSADDSISSLNEAKELCESLNEIESELGLSLVYRSAIDEIDEKISDIEIDLERSKEIVAKTLEAQWG
jgi:hypothetical protein